MDFTSYKFDTQEVYIIVYEFTLTKVGCLRKSTIDIIKREISMSARLLKSKADRIFYTLFGVTTFAFR